MLKQQIEQDLKQALLSGDKDRATTLRSVKSVILNAEVAQGIRDAGLPDDEIIALLAKEAKKRHESADLYIKGGSEERAAKEFAEKEIIEQYLPKQLSDDDLEAIVDAAITLTKATDAQAMGKVIGAVKKEVGSQADGGRIAAIVKERLAKG